MNSNTPKKMNRRKFLKLAGATLGVSTGEVAAKIGQTLTTNGSAVDVYNIENVTDVNAYDAVVVGSAIRRGQWIPSPTDFVKDKQSYLSGIPTAVAACYGY